MIELEQCYCRNENFVFRRIEDETILVPIKDNVGDMGSIYNLNEVGAFIWEHLDGKQNLKVIKDMILAEYDVSSQEVEDDFSEFLTDLIEVEAVLRVYWVYLKKIEKKKNSKPEIKKIWCYLLTFNFTP